MYNAFLFKIIQDHHMGIKGGKNYNFENSMLIVVSSKHNSLRNYY